MTYTPHHHALLCQLLQQVSVKQSKLEADIRKQGLSAPSGPLIDEMLEDGLVVWTAGKHLKLGENGFWVLLEACLLRGFQVPDWAQIYRDSINNPFPSLVRELLKGKQAQLVHGLRASTLDKLLSSPQALPLLPHLSPPWQRLLLTGWSHHEMLGGEPFIPWKSLPGREDLAPEQARLLEYVAWEQDVLLRDEVGDCDWAWHEFLHLLHHPLPGPLPPQLEQVLLTWRKRTRNKGFPPGMLTPIWFGLQLLADAEAALPRLHKSHHWARKASLPGLEGELFRMAQGLEFPVLRDSIGPLLEHPEQHAIPWGALWGDLCGAARQGPKSRVLTELRALRYQPFLAMAPEHLLMELTQCLLRQLLGQPAVLPIFANLAPPPAWERWLRELDKATPRQQPARLIWILSPPSLGVSGKIQKLTAKGEWSQGRQVDYWHLRQLDDALLDDADREVLYLLPDYSMTPPSPRLLEALARHPRLFTPEGTPLQLLLSPPLLEISATPEGMTCRLTPEPDQRGLQCQILAEDLWQLTATPPELCSLLAALKGAPPLPEQALVPLKTALDRIPNLDWYSEVPGLDGNADVTPWPGEPSLRLDWQADSLGLQLVSESEPLPALPLGQGQPLLRDWLQPHHFWRRDLEAEKTSARKIRGWLGLDGRSRTWQLSGQAMLDFMLRLPALIDEQGLRVTWHEHSRRFKTLDDGALSLRIQRDNAWFQVEGELQLDKQQVLDLRLVLRQLKPGVRTLTLDDKTSLLLGDKLAARLTTLAALLDEEQKIGTQLAYPLTRLLESVTTAGDDDWQQLQQEWRQPASCPDALLGPLRDYQKEGVRWLATLARHGFGACLADDMGLGKTLQALTLLRLRRELGPALVLVPKSLLLNWQEEAARFAPELNVIPLERLADRQATLDRLRPGDLLLMSYGLLGSLGEALQARRWASLVADEAQQIKNAGSQRAKALFDLQADFRLALSGTPVENHLGELWSLFNFINPGLLGNQTQFKQRFGKAARDPGHMEQLRGVIGPFVLRRLKGQVLSELPEKTEIVHHVSLSDDERALYEATRQEALQQIRSEEGHALMQLLSSLTRLRRLCCSPALLLPEWKKSHSKLDAAVELILEAIDNGHRLLVFSQFVDLLALLRQRLEAAKLDYCYLDGSCSSRQRQQAIARFQNEAVPLFLISLKAGGTGLNLTQADTVLHLDPWWNPAVEDQASDRAHRMGQTQPVTVYRLVCEHTVEEKIVALHAEKRALADGLLSDQAEVVGLDATLIRSLLGA